MSKSYILHLENKRGKIIEVCVDKRDGKYEIRSKDLKHKGIKVYDRLMNIEANSINDICLKIQKTLKSKIINII